MCLIMVKVSVNVFDHGFKTTNWASPSAVHLEFENLSARCCRHHKYRH